jgi:hypothetical protein
VLDMAWLLPCEGFLADKTSKGGFLGVSLCLSLLHNCAGMQCSVRLNLKLKIRGQPDLCAGPE